jgi:arylsulfatase A-like enzyme
MPTLLECAGLEIPDSVEGRSFLCNARGEDREIHAYVHGEHTVPCGGAAHYLTDGREKYVWFSATGREQLFDLDRDPCEVNDLARGPKMARRLRQWRGRLVRELEGREEGYSDGRKLIAGRPASPVLAHLGSETGNN